MKTQEEIQKEFIDNLFMLRREKGLLQTEMGSSKVVISRMENHTNDPKLSTIIKCLMSLGIDINKLFEEEK